MDNKIENKNNYEKKEDELITFSVPLSLGIIKENTIITTKRHLNLSKDEIYNQAFKLHSQGNILEALKYYQYLIRQGLNDHRIFSNYGAILQDLGKLKEAEEFTRKAIKLKPDCAVSHCNLGGILIDLGELLDAEISIRRSIKLKNDYTKAYHYLSTVKYSGDDKKWQEKLFSKNILKNKLSKDKINIYFARSNILHSEKRFKESAKYLILANDLKLDIKPSNSVSLIKQSNVLFREFEEKEIIQKERSKNVDSIFIVGMPRSGSTLIESIISMNTNVDDLQEINILEQSYLEFKKNDHKLNLAQLYYKKVNNNKIKITTDKCLYNYLYTGIIASQIPDSLIIHCFRNPLDNILSIYRAHFARGNEFSSSLIDCSKVYIDQEKIMTKYKKIFRSKIYDLNYDSLVKDPNKEIRALIAWLGWEWEDSYLSPHLNPRSVTTASNIQVRSPINSNSIDGWKNYREMLLPAIDVLVGYEKYNNLKLL